ncbi:MAG TPA: hypothetical protein VFC68_02520 [Treponemataceae bacterium]|nr:hypothetical protein [Treponemataceae bacterium]
MKKQIVTSYQNFKNGTDTLDTCRNKIVELVFKNPYYFQIAHLQDDLKSTLIILLYDSLLSILTKYNEEYGSFITYLAATIKGLKTRCFREYYRKQATERTAYDYCRNAFPELPKYDPLESILSDASAIDYLPKNKKHRSRTDEHHKPATQKQRGKYTHLNSSEKLLVITLKAAHFLSPQLINKIAVYTKRSTQELEEMCIEINKSLEPRRLKYSEKMQKINNSFLLKNRCSIELEYQYKDSFTYQNRLKAYNFHTKRWNNMIIHKPKPSYLCPTNKQIADLLNITEDQVHYVLHTYGKETDSQKLLNIVLSEHDTIYGNKQPS